MKQLAEKKALDNVFKILLSHRDLEKNTTEVIKFEVDKYLIGNSTY